MSGWRPAHYIHTPPACSHEMWTWDCFTLVGLRMFCLQCGLEVDIPADRLEKLAREVSVGKSA